MTISPDTFAINPHRRIAVHHVGLGRHKVVLVDDFYRHPDAILRMALDLPYTDRFEIAGNFPGVRASARVNTGPVVHAIGACWGVELHPFFHPQPAVFQGITTHDYRLNVGQRQPHIDEDVTAMIYLNPAESCMGGTGLYRHLPTALERVPRVPDHTIRALADQLELSDEFLNSAEGYEHFQNGMIFNPLFANRDNAYINNGNAYWELLFLMQMQPNRLVIFDGRCFHSQHIEADQYARAFRVNQVFYLTTGAPTGAPTRATPP